MLLLTFLSFEDVSHNLYTTITSRNARHYYTIATHMKCSLLTDQSLIPAVERLDTCDSQVA